jgi:hypothetical protein
MIGSDLEGAFNDITVKGELFVLEHTGATGRSRSTCTSQVPEQSGGGCSGT